MTIFCVTRRARNHGTRYHFREVKQWIKRYKNPDDDTRRKWKVGDLSVKTYNANNDYVINSPSGRRILPPKGLCWRVSERTFQKMIDDNRIWFGKDGGNVPAIKRFLSEIKDGVTAMILWKYKDVGHNQDAKKEVKFFHDTEVFSTPKPENLIHRILTLSTNEGVT